MAALVLPFTTDVPRRRARPPVRVSDPQALERIARLLLTLPVQDYGALKLMVEAMHGHRAGK